MKDLRGTLPEGSEPLKNIVHQHTRLLLGVTGTDLKTLPLQPNAEERDLAVQRGKNLGFDQPRPTAPASTSNHTQAYKSWLQTQLRDLGLTRFTFDWESSWKHPFNQLMDVVFYRTLSMALHSGEYNNHPWSPDHATHAIASALLERYFNHLQTQWKLIQKGGETALDAQKARNRSIKTRSRVCERRQQWCDENGYPELAAQFKDPAVCSDTEEILVDRVTKHRKLKLSWRSDGFSALVKTIDHEIQVGSRIGKSRRKKKFIAREEPENTEENPRIPERLSRQVYKEEWLKNLTPGTIENLKIKEVRIMTDDFMPYAAHAS
ncbi:hypothetical protein PTTG_29403 [Puccinia triticina 1-1 BBBD Race 1]|uniref:Uncharacterized protein n=2 Tax=Puccinia triticina TaxID=208348 RepID=A0A180G4B2_PUCT1|nr:uncharacterized protein PtA15_3A837 [Puccinia triticina]OAV87526.1 hypothetical protein PTTG_29403 [Puccinia triticina 1-1 BBBD Race 1]WAQ83466.1 hypothetical protein PtA15_3A837 [Puccinia triticina]WAR54303.1 hypothetical protein PtB15_3B817 [Puccinia triticina]